MERHMGIFDKIKHATFGDHEPLGQFGHPQTRAAEPTSGQFITLHKAVMQALAANGGKVPTELIA